MALDRRRKLEQALDAAGQKHSSRITFVPYELNPNMPTIGMDRKVYRSNKFGDWARSQAMDEQVTQAGVAAGLTFDYARVGKTPNQSKYSPKLFAAPRHKTFFLNGDR